MGPQSESVERSNVATPLSGDVIGLLRDQISQGNFGGPITPLQREAGTAARQFLNSGGGAADRAVADLMGVADIQRERGMADLGEQFGIAGSSLGTPASVGGARFLSEHGARTQQQASDLFMRGLGLDLSGIQMLNQIAQANLAPFMQMAGRGVVNPEVVATDSIFSQLLSGLGGAAQGAGSVIKATG